MYRLLLVFSLLFLTGCPQPRTREEQHRQAEKTIYNQIPKDAIDLKYIKGFGWVYKFELDGFRYTVRYDEWHRQDSVINAEKIK